MQSGPTQPKRGQRISTSLLVTSCALVMPLLLCASFCGLGATYHDQLGLLEPYRAPNLDEATAVIPIEYAIDEHDPNDVVFVGDSTCRTGLDPRLFQKLSGLTAYNLGSSGSLSIWGQFATLTAYLAHHPAPRAVVLCLSPVTVLQSQPATEGSPGAAPTVVETTAGTVCERFLRVYGTPNFHRGIFADGTSSLRYFINRGMSLAEEQLAACASGQTHDRLDDPLFGYESETYRTLRDKLRQTRGFFPLPRTHGEAVGVLEALAEPHAVNPWMDDGVRAFAGLAQTHGFRLVIRLGPLSRDQAPWDSECIPAWLKRLEGEFPQISVSRPEVLWYDRQVCWDCIHVNAGGVKLFTETTARDVMNLVGTRQASHSRQESTKRAQRH
jgi:hypothetical protein